MKRKRIRGKPNREPQHIDGDTWYYEYRGQVLLVHQVRNAEGHRIMTETIGIPWKMLLASLRRCRPEEVKA